MHFGILPVNKLNVWINKLFHISCHLTSIYKTTVYNFSGINFCRQYFNLYLSAVSAFSCGVDSDKSKTSGTQTSFGEVMLIQLKFTNNVSVYIC